MTWKVFRIILLLVAAVIVIFPVVWVISTSIKTDVDIFAIPPMLVPPHPTGSRYAELWIYGLLAYLTNSVIVAISTAVVTIVIGTLAAYSLARFRLPGKWTTRVSFWILSTRMFPPIVTVIPLFQLMRVLGLVNTRFGLVIAYAAFNIPFVVWMMRGFFVEIPKDLEEVAMVDGCSRMRAFRSISLPLVVPGLAATAIFTIILCWQEFLFALILTQTSASSTLPILVSSQVTQYKILWGQMGAAGTITMIPVLIFAFSVQRYLVRGMSFGAIKG
jgi:multiple sugar transport system permease protein